MNAGRAIRWDKAACSASSSSLTIEVAMTDETKASTTQFYCPKCAQPVDDPLVCGDCLAVICRRCGSVLENVDELGVG